jgi:hypothetical protein
LNDIIAIAVIDFPYSWILKIDKKPGTEPAPWAGGILASFPSLTAGSIAKSYEKPGTVPVR